jgi:hypothetical protein
MVPALDYCGALRVPAHGEAMLSPAVAARLMSRVRFPAPDRSASGYTDRATDTDAVRYARPSRGLAAAATDKRLGRIVQPDQLDQVTAVANAVLATVTAVRHVPSINSVLNALRDFDNGHKAPR